MHRRKGNAICPNALALPVLETHDRVLTVIDGEVLTDAFIERLRFLSVDFEERQTATQLNGSGSGSTGRSRRLLECPRMIRRRGRHLRLGQPCRSWTTRHTSRTHPAVPETAHLY